MPTDFTIISVRVTHIYFFFIQSRFKRNKNTKTKDFMQISHSLRQSDDRFQTDFFYSQLAVACMFSPFSLTFVNMFQKKINSCSPVSVHHLNIILNVTLKLKLKVKLKMCFLVNESLATWQHGNIVIYADISEFFLGTLHLFSFDVHRRKGTFLWRFWGTLNFINGK